MLEAAHICTNIVPANNIHLTSSRLSSALASEGAVGACCCCCCTCCCHVQAASREEAAAAEKLPYKVTVTTSDIKFAGTDANVFIEVCGNRWASCKSWVVGLQCLLGSVHSGSEHYITSTMPLRHRSLHHTTVILHTCTMQHFGSTWPSFVFRGLSP